MANNNENSQNINVISKITGSLKIEPHELKPLVWSFVYYFSLLSGYYILRPLRDEMGIQGGVENLQWVFTGTFVVMLLAVPVFGWSVRRYSRSRLVPRVYYFFIINLAIFFFLFKSTISQEWIARAFFIWVSVFNLFVVSVFWSLMSDIYSSSQARRMFGVIAAGGSAGAIVGPALTAGLSTVLGPVNLLPVTIGFLLLAVICVHALVKNNKKNVIEKKEIEDISKAPDERIISGGILAGATRVAKSPYLLGISLFMILYTTLSTFLYFQQAHIVEAAISNSASRTTLFAGIDLFVNVLTVFAQLFITSRVIERFGISFVLLSIPALVAVGFATLALYPILAVLIVFQVVRRAGNYAITRPSREVLYTVVPDEDKYKSKNFIDTVVYRGGDAASGWVFAGLTGLGLSLSMISFIAVPVAVIWAATGFFLGKKQQKLHEEKENISIKSKTIGTFDP